MDKRILGTVYSGQTRMRVEISHRLALPNASEYR